MKKYFDKNYAIEILLIILEKVTLGQLRLGMEALWQI